MKHLSDDLPTGRPRRRTRKPRATSPREAQLLACIARAADGSARVRYFRHPQDSEGVDMVLTAAEVEAFAHALAVAGVHFLTRDDGAARADGRAAC